MSPQHQGRGPPSRSVTWKSFSSYQADVNPSRKRVFIWEAPAGSYYWMPARSANSQTNLVAAGWSPVEIRKARKAERSTSRGRHNKSTGFRCNQSKRSYFTPHSIWQHLSQTRLSPRRFTDTRSTTLHRAFNRKTPWAEPRKLHTWIQIYNWRVEGLMEKAFPSASRLLQINTLQHAQQLLRLIKDAFLHGLVHVTVVMSL